MSQPHPLASFLAATAILALASCSGGAGARIPALLPSQARDPRGHERVRAGLLADLAAAIAQAIRDNDVQCLRGRIQTGREHFASALPQRGPSMPSVHPRLADWFTGHVVAEIEATVKEIHRSLTTRGIDPQRMVLAGPPVVERGGAARLFVSCRLRCKGSVPLRVFFSAASRQLSNGKHIMVLDGGGIFGGLCSVWLTDNELRELRKGEDEPERGYAARIAPLILRHRLHYRWVVLRSQLPYPDLVRERHVEFISNIADGYSGLTDDQRASLRRTLTYSHWPSPYERGEEYLRIRFDESGNALQVFLGGRPIQAPRSEEPDGQ